MWCIKPEDTKHLERTSEWLHILYLLAWTTHKRHAVVLHDATRDGIVPLNESVTDSFSSTIRYYNKCSMKYIGAYQKVPIIEHLNTPDEATFREVQTIHLCIDDISVELYLNMRYEHSKGCFTVT